jgi:Ser-tRNA(Ala) deacylase AlaX
MNGQDLTITKDELVIKLQEECDKLIHGDLEILNQFYEYDSIENIIGKTPDYLPKNKPVRMVTYGGKDGVICPCSGTHVNKHSEIGKFKIRKVQKKGKLITIKYSC